MKKLNLKNKGTSLLEIIIYFAILNVILLIAMTFAIQILSVNSISNNFSELQTNLNFINEKIAVSAQTADGIDVNQSVFDSDSSKVAFNMSDGAVSPTMFYLENGKIYLKEGVSSALQLSSDLMNVDVFRLHRVSYPKSPDQIIIDMEVSVASQLANGSRNLSAHFSLSLRK